MFGNVHYIVIFMYILLDMKFCSNLNGRVTGRKIKKKY